MNLSKVIIPAVLSFALGAPLSSAMAQEQQRERHDRQQQAQSEQQRGQNQPRRAPAQPRDQGQQRGQARPRAQQPAQQQPPQQPPPPQEQRQARPAQPQARASQRGERERGVEQRTGRIAGPRPEVGTRGAAPPRAYREGDRYERPYYDFRRRAQVGFGIWIGYPVAYPYYGAYPPSVVYGYPGGAVTEYGGISFEISPPDADVYVDGGYAGRVGQFTASAPPLTLLPGEHRIELEADGFQRIVFDVNVVPGEVIPYQGAMAPAF